MSCSSSLTTPTHNPINVPLPCTVHLRHSKACAPINRQPRQGMNLGIGRRELLAVDCGHTPSFPPSQALLLLFVLLNHPSQERPFSGSSGRGLRRESSGISELSPWVQLTHLEQRVGEEKATWLPCPTMSLSHCQNLGSVTSSDGKANAS